MLARNENRPNGYSFMVDYLTNITRLANLATKNKSLQ
jgi:hypothetical protein